MGQALRKTRRNKNNLPANMWSEIAPRLNAPTLARMRAVSTEARRGSNAQVRKVKVLKTAYRSATAATIRPLVAALKAAPMGAWHPRDVQVGRYALRVLSDAGPPPGRWPFAGVFWMMPGNQHLLVGRQVYTNWGFLLGYPSYLYAQGGELPRGGVSLLRLVKAAFKEAFGAN